MKYIWIIMLIIAYIIWAIFAIKDAIFTWKHKRFREHFLEWLDGYTIVFIIAHFCLLFGYSLALYINGMK